MIVCHCAAVNDRRIRELAAQGAHDLLAVANACGAGSFCGGCAPLVASMLSDATGTPAARLLESTPTTAGEAQPVRFRKRVEAVVREILDDIASDGWPVGRALGSRTELAQRYEVSQGLVRQAVRLLTHHGLVEDTARGLVVASPTPSTIGEAAAIHLHHAGVTLHDVAEVRRTVEEVMVQRATRNRAPDLREAFRAATVGPAAGRDLAKQYVDFHLALADLSTNPAYRLLVDALIRLARDLAPVDTEAVRERRKRQTAVEHREIAEAVLAGDEERSRSLMAAHLDAFYESIPAKPPAADVIAQRRAHEAERPAVVVARSVACDIRERGLEAGASLGSEKELTERYAVPRDLLRQAAGLLELYSVAHPRVGPGGGLVVGPPDMWAVAQLMAWYLDYARIELSDIAELRYALELRAVELASVRLDRAGAERLRQRLREEVDTRARGAGGQSGFHNVHPYIAELSGNRVLALFTGALILVLVRRLHAAAPRRRPLSRGEDVSAVHTGIVEGIVAGDLALARRRMHEHLVRHMRPGAEQDPG